MRVLQYSVIRYLPDPAREEHINIGVVLTAADAAFAACKFTRDWARCKRFGREDASFLRDFAAELKKALLAQRELFATAFSSHDLSALAANWRNSIQFSTPRASVEQDPESLLSRLFEQFVGDRAQRRFAPRRTHFVAEAKRELKRLIQSRFEDKAPLVLGRETLRGRVGQHRFDVLVKNGAPLICLDAISVEEEDADFDEHVRATGWDLQDVRRNHRQLALGVMLIDASKKQIEQTARLFRPLRTTVFPQKELGDWARRQVAKLPRANQEKT